MSDPRYKDGDVVWCKCGGLFWPGEVKGLASLPTEIREGFLRMPLVVVKFFDEDGYEFVLNEKDIHPYNCNKKTDFVQKGLARFRTKAKEGATDGWFAKFPKDVLHSEKLTGGNVNLLDQEPFTEKKDNKVDYSKIFGEKIEKDKEKDKVNKEKKGKKLKTPKKGTDKQKETKSSSLQTPTSTSSANTKKERQTPKITHPRFLKESDHQVRILTQPSTPYHMQTNRSTPQSKLETTTGPAYRCPLCDFATARLNVIVLHSKTHSASKVSYATKPDANAAAAGGLVRRVEKSRTPQQQHKQSASSAFADAGSVSKKRERPSNKQDKKLVGSPSKKPRLNKKEREVKREQEKKREEDKQRLLIDWSEDENEEAEEYRKIQDSINKSLRSDSLLDEDAFPTDDFTGYSIDSDEEDPLLNSSRMLTSGDKSPPPKEETSPPHRTNSRIDKDAITTKLLHHQTRVSSADSSIHIPTTENENGDRKRFASVVSPPLTQPEKMSDKLSFLPSQPTSTSSSTSTTCQDIGLASSSNSLPIRSTLESITDVVGTSRQVTSSQTDDKVVREQKDDSSRRVPESSAYGGGSTLDRPETVENVESASNDVTRLTTTSPNCPVINHRNESELMRLVDTEPDLQSKDILQKVPLKMAVGEKDEDSRTSSRPITPVKDMFDIDQALDETSVPDIPSYKFSKFRDFSSFKKRQNKAPNTISPTKPLEKKSVIEPTRGLEDELVSADQAANRDVYSMYSEEGLCSSPPSSPPPKRRGILRTMDHGSIQLPSRPDGNAKLIRHSSPTSNGAKLTKFPTISAKIKAKQLAREAQKLEAQEAAANAEKTNHEKNSSALMEEPQQQLQEQQQMPDQDKQVVTPVTVDDAPTSTGQCPPSSVVPAVTSPAMDGGSVETSEDQIYYMLVDDGSQLDNQTIFIDEAQLSRSGHANVLIQDGVDGQLLVQGSAEGELVVQGGPQTDLLGGGGPANVGVSDPGGDFLLQSRTGTRTVLLQDSNGQLVNVVVADERDMNAPVSSADTSGGVATLPYHPSYSPNPHLPLITTPSGQMPIMITSTNTTKK